MAPPLLTPDQIAATRAVIDPVFLDSPLTRHPALDEALGCAVTLKVETLNPIRSFKGRGTEAALAGLTPRPPAVVTAGIAALMQHRARFQGAAVACVITGSNADPRLLARLAG